MHKKTSRIKNLIPPIEAFILLILTWQTLDYLLQIKKIILPNPIEITIAFYTNITIILYHTLITLIESIIGFLLGTLLGFLIASLFTFNTTLKKSLYPYAIGLKATPLFTIAPILVVWFGSGILSKIIMSALVAFFPILVNSYKGLTTLNQETLDLFKSMKATKFQTFTKLQIPNALPFIFSSLKIASTLAVVGATIAEFTGSTKGIGYLIINSSYYLETDLVFASIIAVSLIGIFMFYLVEYLEKKIIYWL